MPLVISQKRGILDFSLYLDFIQQQLLEILSRHLVYNEFIFKRQPNSHAVDMSFIGHSIINRSLLYDCKLLKTSGSCPHIPICVSLCALGSDFCRRNDQKWDGWREGYTYFLF